jgi:hypothetical protein
MSEMHNDKLRNLAKRSNAELMDSISAFVQGFIMGRNYESEFRTQLYNSILHEMRESSGMKFDDNNWWDNRISELEKENFELKSKYVWSED